MMVKPKLILRNITVLILIGFFFWGCSSNNSEEKTPPHELVLYDINAMLYAKDQYLQGKEPYLSEVNGLIKAADGFMDSIPPSVIDNEIMPPSGDIHDYTSMGPYWWPDPEKEDGLPYIRHDGVRNPERYKHDRFVLSDMSDASFYLALAWFYTGEEKYAVKSGEFLRRWFLDPETKMNPHLKFAQTIPGRDIIRGTGIIESLDLINVVEAVGLLQGSGALNDTENEGMYDWFKSYTEWLTTSEWGWYERMQENNHGSSYDLQLALYAMFTDQDSIARMVLDSVKTKRIDQQIEADGSQPHELERTNAMGYSIFNLKHLYRCAVLAEKYEIDLWNYQNPKGAGLLTATRYLIPFLTGEKAFPYQQIRGLEGSPANFLSLLDMAGGRLNDPMIWEFMELHKEPLPGLDYSRLEDYRHLIYPFIGEK
tara:strand:+ start:11800 stop:13074 length:1275 start_codon:yes stop_codon:yes gene_type:complete